MTPQFSPATSPTQGTRRHIAWHLLHLVPPRTLMRRPPRFPNLLSTTQSLRAVIEGHLKETTPKPDPPVPEDTPRGLQVLLHKAHSGTAVPPDVRERWTLYRRFGRKRPDGSTPVPPPTLPCPLCSANRPTIHHHLWDCAGLSEERRRCLPPHVTSLQERITPSSDVKDTLMTLWDFAGRTGLVKMT